MNLIDVHLKVRRNHLLERAYATENSQGVENTVLENNYDIEVESQCEGRQPKPDVNVNKYTFKSEEPTQVMNLLLKYSDVFSEKPGRKPEPMVVITRVCVDS